MMRILGANHLVLRILGLAEQAIARLLSYWL
jgi:hypothetical protein